MRKFVLSRRSSVLGYTENDVHPDAIDSRYLHCVQVTIGVTLPPPPRPIDNDKLFYVLCRGRFRGCPSPPPCFCRDHGGGALECQGVYQARPKIHVIRVVFQDQAPYARTSVLGGAKTCKIGKKSVFLVI